MTTSTFPGAADNDTNLYRVIASDALIPGMLNNKTDAIEAIENTLLASTSPTTEFLRGDMTFHVPAGGGGGGLAELAYVESSTPGSITATSEATAQVMVTLPSVTYAGTPVEISFFLPLQEAYGNCVYVLWDDTAGVSLGYMAEYQLGAGTECAVSARRRLTPAAGARVYSIRAWTGTTATVYLCGAGGAGNYCPMFARVVG